MRRVSPLKGMRGSCTVPGDKSISHRAALLGALSREGMEISGYAPGEDCGRTLACLDQLGCRVLKEGPRVHVSRGEGIRECREVLYAGNSGTSARLLCGLLAGVPGFFGILAGDASLSSRPMDRVVAPLRSAGARIDGREGGSRLPLSIRGASLVGGSFTLPVASAQVKTALLLAGLSSQGSVTVTEPSPSRDHTERMLGFLGVPLVREENKITLFPYPELPGAAWEIPGDFSSAAFWIVAAALLPDSELLLEKVGLNPTRTGLLEVLKRMGLRWETEALRESGGEPLGNLRIRTASLEGTRVEASEVPRMVDELPVLAVAATQATGKTEIRGARELRYKECDRIRGMAEGLAALGADIEELEDGWIVTGPTPLHGGSVKTLGDHRVAMALSVAAAIAEGPVDLDDPECVNISYPSFFESLERFAKGSPEA